MRVYNNTNQILHVGKISLPPGVSEVLENDFKEVNKHPIMQSWIELGQVEVENGDLTDIADVKPASKALKVIESTFNAEKLEAWSEKEKRSPVIAAIQEQIKYLSEKSNKTVKNLLSGEQDSGEQDSGEQDSGEDNA